jgi:hypothetical protein
LIDKETTTSLLIEQLNKITFGEANEYACVHFNVDDHTGHRFSYDLFYLILFHFLNDGYSPPFFRSPQSSPHIYFFFEIEAYP